MKRILLIMALAGVGVLANAEDIRITTVKYAGPYAMQQPFMVDETDVNNKKYSAETLIDTPLPLTDVFASNQADLKGNDGLTIPKSGVDHALHLLGFTMQNNRYGKAKITVDGRMGIVDADSANVLIQPAYSYVNTYFTPKGMYFIIGDGVSLGAYNADTMEIIVSPDSGNTLDQVRSILDNLDR